MAIINISGTISSSFSGSGVLANAAQAAGDAIFTIDLRPTTPVIIVQDNLVYSLLGWDINDVVAVIILSGPEGNIYRNEDFNSPDIVPATSRYLNKTITLPLDPLTNYTNILKGNYTLKVMWYNSVLDEYYNYLKTYQYDLTPPTIANTTVSGPYTGVLKSTDTTVYGNDVHQIIREHRVIYPDELDPQPADVVSSNDEIQVTPIYTNEWTIQINSFVEYRYSDTLRVFWEGSGEFFHCVYGGCIGAMYDAIVQMLATYTDELACNLINKENYQQRLTIVNTAWHLLNEAYWSGDADGADEQAYIIQEQVAYTGSGTCGGPTSEEVIPCPPWTGGGGIGGEYTFYNALTEAAGDVVWGGTLTQATTVNMIGYQVLFSGSYSGNTVSQSISSSGGILQKAGDGTTEGRVYITDNLLTLEYADIGTPANTRGYEVGPDGIVEKADYSAGYTDLSLVNKLYVDNLDVGISAVVTDATLSGDGTAGDPLSVVTPFPGFTDLPTDYGYTPPTTWDWSDIVNTPTTLAGYGITDAADTFLELTDTPASYAGFGGYFIRVNTGATALEFVVDAWVPVTGGTFTGPVTIASSTDRLFILQQIGAGSTPGTPEGGWNLISFQDNDGDEQGYIGIDNAGNVVLSSWVSGAGVLVDSDLEVNGDIIVTGLVDGVDIAAWYTYYNAHYAEWDEAYSWGDHAGLYQPLDADLTSIAGLGFSETAFLTKTAANTWALDTTIYAELTYVESLALTYVYVPDSMNVVTSDGYTGTVTNVQTLDGTYVQIEEVASTPGYEVRFNFIDVIDFNDIFLYLKYNGGATHTVNIDLYNYNTLGWDTFEQFTDMYKFTIIDIPVPLTDDYINGSDEVILRIYHGDAGNATHDIQIDYVCLRQTPQLGGGGGVTDHGGLTGLSDDDHPQYALADGSRCIYYIPSGAKSTASDAGIFGQTSMDDDYIYVCTQTGTAGNAVWKKIPIVESP